MAFKQKPQFADGSLYEPEKQHSPITVNGPQAETEDIFTDGALDPVYHAKARILNDALQEIGMGKYQVS
jgi:hypothetical protein